MGVVTNTWYWCMFEVLWVLMLLHCMPTLCTHPTGPAPILYNTSAMSATYQDASDLSKMLVAGDASTLPVYNQNDVLDVRVQLDMLVLNRVHESEEWIKTSVKVRMFWKDEQLVWNQSTMYGGIPDILLRTDRIWKPELAITNIVSENPADSQMPLLVSSTGDISWTPTKTIFSKCHMDVYYYPFDEQHCVQTFTVQGYSKYQINFNSSSSMNMDSFKINSEWDVSPTKVVVHELGDSPGLSFHFKLKRRPAFVVMANIIPVMMMSILSVSVFIMPNNSGEKNGYAITVFLAFSVIMLMIVDGFPRNFFNLSVFIVYMLLQTIQSTITTFLSISSVRLSSLDATNAPVYPSLLKFYRFYKIFRRKKTTGKSTSALFFWQKEKDVSPEDEEEQTHVTPNPTWNEVLNVLDLVCFIFFSIVFVSSTFAFLLIIVFKY